MFRFYCFSDIKKIIFSDQPIEIIKAEFGHNYEILNSVQDKDAVSVIKDRLKRIYRGFKIVKFAIVVKKRKKMKKVSLQTRKKMSLAKTGLVKSPETRAKTSATMKGKSNFEGKKHTQESRNKAAASKMGNTYVKGTVWAYSAALDKEIRVKDLSSIPAGYTRGRDCYSTEPAIYNWRISGRYGRPTNSPKEK